MATLDLLDPDDVREFVRLLGQLKALHEEISLLSKKSPDGAMNRFKIRFINDILKKTTALLGEEFRPFAEFEIFADDELPTTSDVTLMLSQYLSSMSRFQRTYTRHDDRFHKTYWKTKGNNEIQVGSEEG